MQPRDLSKARLKGARFKPIRIKYQTVQTCPLLNSAASLCIHKLGKNYAKICMILFFFLRIVDSKPHSRMWYRIGAVRNMTGGRKTQPATKMNEKLKEVRAGPRGLCFAYIFQKCLFTNNN